MLFTTIGILVYANLVVPRHQRAFTYLSAAITGTASIAYFAMASDLGSTDIQVEFLNGFDVSRTGGMYPTRSIWYARYIDWTITTPLLLLELLLVSGMPLSNIFLTVFWDLVMIETGLIGALVESQYKWGFFVFGCVAMFLVFYDLIIIGWSSAKKLDASLGRTYITGTGILLILWTLYPVAWGLADGSNTISPDGEMIFYGVLDLLAKPVFAIVHLWGLRKLDYDVLGLQSGKRSAYLEAAGHTGHQSGKSLESGHGAYNGNGNGTSVAAGSSPSEGHTVGGR